MNTCCTDAAELYLIIQIFFFKSVSLKYDNQAFEERLFVHLSIIIVLHYIACF